MTQPQLRENQIISFLRNRDYRFVRELGQGACGRTILLHDDQIEEYFVCKKYAPYSESQREILFGNFVREIKLLHQIHHPNVVRVFNYYLYPESSAGYILMEFVDGSDIEDYAKSHPEQVNELFMQAISGFGYLERSRVLHRDIRPGNMLIGPGGHLKIIDLGFGKRIRATADFEKSVTLNWWCQPPGEFRDGRYDFATEVYFVGKLFERIIQENEISHFNFTDVLGRMCQHDAFGRVQSFAEVERAIQSDKFFEIGFSDEELEAYRDFADSIAERITKIENGSKYMDDADRIQASLNDAYRTFMLEEFVPNANKVLRCLVVGNYYFKRKGLGTRCVRDFVRLLQTSSPEQRRIIIANLHTRLDALPRYSALEDDDVPF
jgi:serine/threonine protein kinase